MVCCNRISKLRVAVQDIEAAPVAKPCDDLRLAPILKKSEVARVTMIVEGRGKEVTQN